MTFSQLLWKRLAGPCCRSKKKSRIKFNVVDSSHPPPCILTKIPCTNHLAPPWKAQIHSRHLFRGSSLTVPSLGGKPTPRPTTKVHAVPGEVDSTRATQIFAQHPTLALQPTPFSPVRQKVDFPCVILFQMHKIILSRTTSIAHRTYAQISLPWIELNYIFCFYTI